MLNEIVAGVLTSVITAVAVYCITVLFRKFTEWLNVFIKKYELDVDTKTVDLMMTEFKTTLTQAIIATNQTLVNDLKKTGKFDSDAMAKAMSTTIDYCKKMLADDVLDYLEVTYDDVDELIRATTETIIGASKNKDVDVDLVVNTIVRYLSKLPDYNKYSMDEIIAEVRTKFNIPD